MKWNWEDTVKVIFRKYSFIYEKFANLSRWWHEFINHQQISLFASLKLKRGIAFGRKERKKTFTRSWWRKYKRRRDDHKFVFTVIKLIFDFPHFSTYQIEGKFNRRRQAHLRILHLRENMKRARLHQFLRNSLAAFAWTDDDCTQKKFLRHTELSFYSSALPSHHFI